MSWAHAGRGRLSVSGVKELGRARGEGGWELGERDLEVGLTELAFGDA